MVISIQELTSACESANRIMDELQLDAYLHELQSQDDTWELRIECACEVDGGWDMLTIQVPKRMYAAGVFR